MEHRTRSPHRTGFRGAALMPRSRALFLFLATLAFFVTTGILHNLFPVIENALYDLGFACTPDSPTDSVAIVAIDRRSVNEIGPFPWRRATIARLVEQIASHEPSAIALNFYFPRREGDTDNDSLAAVFSRVDNLVLPFRAGAITPRPLSGSAFIPVEALAYRFHAVYNTAELRLQAYYCTNKIDVGERRFMRHASRSGFLNISTSRMSQKLREIIHILRLGEHYFPSLALATAASHLKLSPRAFALDGKGRVVLGDITFPLSSLAGTSYLSYRGRSGTIKNISAAQILRGEVDTEELRNKPVFVGVTDPSGSADFFTTPVGVRFPGVEIWATATLDILRDSYVRKDKPGIALAQWILALLIFPGLAATLPDNRRKAALLSGSCLALAGILASIFLFRHTTIFWNAGFQLYALAFTFVWFSVKKPAAATKTSTEKPNLDQPSDLEQESLPPPREHDFITSIPRTSTAEYVARKVAESFPLLNIGMDTLAADDTEGGDEIEVVAEIAKLAGGRIVRPLGSGGMADVYLVWNPRMEVYRAIKVLKPEQPARVLDRFETEIRIFANLNHPNIVQCYSVGDWHGLPYLEMDFLNGIAFDRLLLRIDALTPAETCAVGILIARALQYAHTQVVTVYGKTYRGVIHRDLKPANILLSRGGRIKLTDFGIARPASVSLHTLDQNRVLGTLPYLAPEQCSGHPVTAKVDIYALGETLYELVSGHRAFPQEDIMCCAAAKSKGEFVPLRELVQVPRRLDAAIRKAMATKPAARYQTAAAMCADLESILNVLAPGIAGRRILPRLADRYGA
ncbi:MAG: CHASE2 domain-containing protein [Chitinivibrionales bacterium]|nr:CHASE2 domain-containing protein [Chitinivibrionales bacterium]MBD3358546.1 CHASE2 domain-containing protein [Chitinivibrionales bacterium]